MVFFQTLRARYSFCAKTAERAIEAADMTAPIRTKTTLKLYLSIMNPIAGANSPGPPLLAK